MDLGAWLRSLGLERYEGAFRENEIDETVLPSLTHETLKELGVTAVGHRLKLLDAIAALRTDGGTKGPSAVAATVPATPRVSSEDRAERRQVTVMFSDLVGSTSLSARMDPEDLREIISTYQKCVAETIQRFGGFVAQCLGDGALVYFGYPQAHEDDAERAVRAGLELITAVSALKTHAPLQTRVGIATGVVVVGDLVGSAASQEQAIVGETPNLAARLQAAAEPNSVVIAENTKKLVGDLFELDDLGAQELKGIPGLVTAWAALRPASVESRFEALHASGLTELVGREEEVDLLLRRWSKAKSGQGQAVLLSGEPGIGKSRLTAVLLGLLANEPHTRLRYFCSPLHTDSTFYPIISQMERAATLTRDDTPKTKLDKLDALLAQTSTSIQDAALFAEMLSLPNDGRYPKLELLPQQRRQKTLEALIGQTEALTRQHPVLMILEDAQWIDPTSLELFGQAIERIANRRVLLIVTSRPEFIPRWIGKPHITALTINRLGQRDVETMIDGIIGNGSLPPSIRQDIVARTDGIPLFIEEMTKAEHETKIQHDAYLTASLPFISQGVPLSLQASLMARLDRLGPAKEIAQIAAAIGRDFSYSLLSAVAHMSDARLQWALDQLVGAGLLFRQNPPPHTTYLFKHALVRDAAYGTLLRNSRRTLHACIAENIESQFADVAENQPQLLARHCTEGGLVEKAASLWGKASQRSLDRSAMTEAVAQSQAALKLLRTLPECEPLRNLELKLEIVLARALVAIHGAAADEPAQAYDRARALCEKLNDDATLPSIVIGQWYACLIGAKYGDGIKQAKALLQLGEQQNQNSATWKTLANYGIGHCLLALGEFKQAQMYLAEALELNQFELAGGGVATWGLGDARVITLAYLQQSQFILGWIGKAQETERRALAYAASLTQPYAKGLALAVNCRIHAIQRNVSVVSKSATELLALGNEQGFLMFSAFAKVYLGWAMALDGEARTGVELCHAGIVLCRRAGIRLALSLHLGLYAEALSKAASPDEALSALREAAQEIVETDERFWEAELLRLEGEFEGDRGVDLRRAETCFRQALTVAQHQGAHLFELRAATSLARLLVQSGRRAAANDILVPVLALFGPEFDIAEITQATALMQVLCAANPQNERISDRANLILE
jgi:predicted ATPase/class 3 adenylate cyclase